MRSTRPREVENLDLPNLASLLGCGVSTELSHGPLNDIWGKLFLSLLDALFKLGIFRRAREKELTKHKALEKARKLQVPKEKHYFFYLVRGGGRKFCSILVFPMA